MIVSQPCLDWARVFISDPWGLAGVTLQLASDQLLTSLFLSDFRMLGTPGNQVEAITGGLARHHAGNKMGRP